MIEEKKFEGEPVNYDVDSYDEAVEEPTPVTIKETVETPTLSGAITARDLLIYFVDRYKETHGFNYVVEWVKEIAIFKSFIERYGSDAGPMVQLLFDKHNGKMNDIVLTATAFTKGSKWMQDKLYIELQQEKKKKENKACSEGLMDTDEFLKRFAV